MSKLVELVEETIQEDLEIREDLEGFEGEELQEMTAILKKWKEKVKGFTIKGAVEKAKKAGKKQWLKALREFQESKEAYAILDRMLKRQKVSDAEKKILYKQIGDLVKMLGLGTASVPPGGSIAVAVIVKALQMVGIQALPSSWAEKEKTA